MIQVIHREWVSDGEGSLAYAPIVENFKTEAEYLNRLRKEREDADFQAMCGHGDASVGEGWLSPVVFKRHEPEPSLGTCHSCGSYVEPQLNCPACGWAGVIW
jgi:hypothetical protein